MNGKTIALLENRAEARLADLVRKYGGRPFSAPALAEVPDIDTDYISSLLHKPAKVAIFQTGVGTKVLFETTDALGLTEMLLRLLSESLVVARGPKPKAVLRSRGETNVELDKALEARGATVIETPTYRWAMPANIQPLVDLMDALARSEIDVIAFTSAAQARNLFSLAEALGRLESLKIHLSNTMAASIDPVCTRMLEKLGVVVAIEARPPNWGLLCRHLAKCYPVGEQLVVRLCQDDQTKASHAQQGDDVPRLPGQSLRQASAFLR